MRSEMASKDDTGGVERATPTTRRRTRRKTRGSHRQRQQTPYSELPWQERRRLEEEDAARAAAEPPPSATTSRKRKRSRTGAGAREQPPPAPRLTTQSILAQRASPVINPEDRSSGPDYPEPPCEDDDDDDDDQRDAAKGGADSPQILRPKTATTGRLLKRRDAPPSTDLSSGSSDEEDDGSSGGVASELPRSDPHFPSAETVLPPNALVSSTSNPAAANHDSGDDVDDGDGDNDEDDDDIDGPPPLVSRASGDVVSADNSATTSSHDAGESDQEDDGPPPLMSRESGELLQPQSEGMRETSPPPLTLRGSEKSESLTIVPSISTADEAVLDSETSSSGGDPQDTDSSDDADEASIPRLVPRDSKLLLLNRPASARHDKDATLSPPSASSRRVSFNPQLEDVRIIPSRPDDSDLPVLTTQDLILADENEADDLIAVDDDDGDSSDDERLPKLGLLSQQSVRLPVDESTIIVGNPQRSFSADDESDSDSDTDAMMQQGADDLDLNEIFASSDEEDANFDEQEAEALAHARLPVLKRVGSR
eukprot:m.132857 g.132857  ORF g.132857 m.132857 type:complete len:539 (-) comp9840_c1_seq1:100-1716(-)